MRELQGALSEKDVFELNQTLCDEPLTAAVLCQVLEIYQACGGEFFFFLINGGDFPRHNTVSSLILARPGVCR